MSGKIKSNQKKGNMYKDLLFDLDDCLLDFSTAAKWSFKELMLHFNLKFSDELYEIFKKHNSEIWKEIEEKNEITIDILNTSFSRFFNAAGIEGKQAEWNEIFINLISKHPILYDDTIEVLQKLHKNHRIYIVSNGISYVQSERLKISGIEKYIDGDFVSWDIGSTKPHREFFDYVFNHINCFDKSTTLLIGDNLNSDILGGIRSGIDTCWINRNNSMKTLEINPTYEIRSLNDLDKIIE